MLKEFFDAIVQLGQQAKTPVKLEAVDRERVLIRDRKPEICGDFVSMNLVLGDDVANVPADTLSWYGNGC